MPRYRIVDVQPDGACLFRCLSLARNKELLAFKSDLVDFITSNPDTEMNRSNVTYREAIAS